MSDAIDFVTALKDKKNVLLLIFGANNSLANEILEAVSKCAVDGNLAFWIQDPNTLTPVQKSKWYQSEDRYTVVSCVDFEPTDQGPLTSLYQDGIVSDLKINAAFESA